MTRDEIVTRMATAMIDWARGHEPLRSTPQEFREMAGAALDASTLLSTYRAADAAASDDQHEAGQGGER